MVDEESHLDEEFRHLDPYLKKYIDSQNPPSLLPLLWVSLGVFVLWLLVGFLPWFLQEGLPWNLSWGLSQAGTFGDSFGFVNSLFSGLAMAGVIVALWYQRLELAEQRKELIITQWELRKSAQAQRESQIELAKQVEMNINSNVFSALSGIAEFSMKKPERHEMKDEVIQREANGRFANELRSLLLVEMLSNDTAASLRTTIGERLKRWSTLTALETIAATSGYELENLNWKNRFAVYGDATQVVSDAEIDKQKVHESVEKLRTNLDRIVEAMKYLHLDMIEELEGRFSSLQASVDSRSGSSLKNALISCGELLVKIAEKATELKAKVL